MDAAAELEIFDLLAELNKDITIILVSHDLGMVSQAVQRVLCVNRLVRRHPTCDITDVSGKVLSELYDGVRVVRHDLAESDD